MAIVKMSKFNLIFFAHDHDQLLERLQQFKYVHFLNLKENEMLKDIALDEIVVESKTSSIDGLIDKTTFIIDSLKSYDRREKGIKQIKKGLASFNMIELEEKAKAIDIVQIYDDTKKAIDEKERIKRHINSLKEKIDSLRPWVTLNTSLSKFSSFKTCRIHSGIVPNQLLARFTKEVEKTEYTYFDVVNKDGQYSYIVIITHESEEDFVQKIMMNNGFNEVKLDDVKRPKETILDLKEKIELYKVEIQSYDRILYNLSERIDSFELLYDYFMMKKTRFLASENFLRTEKLNIMEGYIPTKFEEKFEQIIKKQLGNNYYLHIKKAQTDDPNVPIMLQNSNPFKAFESVTEMYALPKYNEIDPTPLFSIFYALFFGMMIGDAGYGLIMLLITFLVLKLLNLTSKQRNFFKFFYYLSFSTIIWGAIFGSFLGDLFKLPALIDTSEQYNFLLTLSIILGGIHVFFALSIQAYMEIKRGNVLNAFFDVGFWYMLLSGGIVYILSMFFPIFLPYKTVGLTVMIVGMIGVLLTGGRDQKGVGSKLAGGLYSLYGLSSYIGDFVSYSRLMALALASGFIAYAINLMVGMLFNLGVIGIIFGIIVFIIGQGFNLFLSILSSYVHALRLTYVEFFGKFYEGGGKPFQTFRNVSKYIEIK